MFLSQQREILKKTRDAMEMKYKEYLKTGKVHPAVATAILYGRLDVIVEFVEAVDRRVRDEN
jgi:hypothetical protein